MSVATSRLREVATRCTGGGGDVGLLARAAKVAAPVVRGRNAARLSILIYHRISERPDPFGWRGLSLERFESHLRVLRDLFTPISLGDALAALERDELPADAACVTFDDGYADNAELALPALERHGVPATFFVATGFLDGGCMFNDTVIEAVLDSALERLDLAGLGIEGLPAELGLVDDAARHHAIGTILDAVKHLAPARRARAVETVAERAGMSAPPRPMMTSAQVRQLADAGMEIGGHTVTHPILCSIDDEQARDEICTGRDSLRDITGRPIPLFAYPNGKPGSDYDARHVRMVREAGFTAAVSTAVGASDAASDRFQLPRFTPWDRHPGRFVLRLLGNQDRRAEGLA